MSSPEPQGRLELTWTNKHLRLLAHEDGSYQWVDPSDHRVAEVRLLREAARVNGTTPGNKGTTGNLLIRGDALHALQSLSRLPDYASELVGKVRLVYIDPPFNTQQSFLEYDDALEHSVWLTMLRDRLLQTRSLLSEDGTVWVHLDDWEAHRGRMVLDEVFGPANFVATFVWRKVDSPSDNKTAVVADHEYIYCYAKDIGRARLLAKPDPGILDAYRGPDAQGRLYRDRLLKKSGKNSLRGDRPSMFFPVIAPDGSEVLPIHDDGREACWALGKESVQRLVESGELIWKEQPGPNGRGTRWRPYTREYAPDEPTRPWPTIWTDLPTTRQTKAHHRKMFAGQTVFATPKPEELLARIMSIGTDPGDIVLDFFSGSGTTAAVAHKMGRRWIAVERSEETIASFTLPRLGKVVEASDAGGITQDVGWKGGGAFTVLDVASTMFQEEGGIVYLADWAAGGELGEATAAQLGFAFEPEAAPFCGQKGRCRLAVIDGHVNRGVVELLSSFLGEGETMVVCGTSLDPGAVESLPSGSEIKKIPNVILDEYRKRYRVRRRSQLGLNPTPQTPALGTPA